MIHSLEIENARLKKDTVGQHSQTAVEQYRSTIRKLESETEKTFRQLQ